MRTSSRSASSSTASRQRGPSVLGISTRYCAPSGKRFAESGSSFRSPGGSPIERRKSRASRSYSASAGTVGLRLLEQRLPAVEQRLELVARRPVRGEELHVAPVVGELPLELGDRLLLRCDRGLDLLELARAFRSCPLRPRLRFVALRTQSLRPELRNDWNSSSTGDSSGRSPPSRRRSCGSSRPRSRASARRPRRGGRGRGRRAARSRGSSPAQPRAPRGSRGRGGSSARRGRGSSPRTRRRPRARAAAARRPRAPRTGFSCVSQPEKRNRPSRFWASGRRSPVIDWTHSSTEPRSSSSASCCEKYAGTTPWPSRTCPRRLAAGRAASPAASSSRSRSARPARRARRARPRASRRRADACRPPRATGPRPRRPSSRCAAGSGTRSRAASTRRVSSASSSEATAFSFFSRPMWVSFACACFAFDFLYRNRSTNRWSRAMSAL